MKTLIEMAQEIVLAQASTKTMTTEEVKVALQEAFNTLKSLDAGTETEVAKEAEIDPKKSIKKNKIVCLECGQEFKMLSAKHLETHGLNAKSYREKYGFSKRQSLCAKSLSETRAKSAKVRGIPEKMREYIDARRAKKVDEATD